ncbi:MAG: sulfatase-like hydrolase/transferase, partial [Clostridia bacterium]
MKRPNLLLLIADQLRADCVGYAKRYPVKTPHLDALARESVVYTRAYAAMPVCAPMRQSLLCGRHPDSFGALTNYDITPTPDMDPKNTWTRRLKDDGYTGGLVGNLHAPYHCDLSAFGFDDYIARSAYQAEIRSRYPNVQYTNGYAGEPSPLPLEDSMTHWNSSAVCSLLDQYAQGDAPWFIWSEFLTPHLPCRPSEPFASLYAPEEILPWDGFGDDFVGKPYMQRQQSLNWRMENHAWSDIAPIVARYKAMISQMDDAVGRIIARLKALGSYDETTIVFVSDHGDMCGSHQTLDKGYNLFEDVTHVPMMVKAPDTRGCICEAFVSSFLDLNASIYEWTQSKPPIPGHGCPLPMKAGEQNGRSFITSAYDGQQFGMYCQRMIRDDRFKYVWN